MLTAEGATRTFRPFSLTRPPRFREVTREIRSIRVSVLQEPMSPG
jgi:hypothetical protein